MTSTDNDRLKRLEKRMNFLNTRIYQAGDKDLSFDRAEASALEWAIGIIEQHLGLKDKECVHNWRESHTNLSPNGGSSYRFYCTRCLTKS